MKTYMVLTHEGEHEYNISVKQKKNGKKFKLFRSNGHQWSESSRGELVLTMVDNGNGVKFNKNLKKLDYDELCVLRILINLEQVLDSNPKNQEKYRLIENKVVIEI